MQIDNEFTVSVPIERAWAVLTDLAAIAPCMPGAQLTGVEGEVYNGKIKVKVGPVTSEYAGTARFKEKDDAGYHAVIDASGRDVRGAGNASAAITAKLSPQGPQTLVRVSTDLKISGRIAQFGSGMIKEVSAKLLGQFTTCLESKLAAAPAEAGAAVAPPGGAAPAQATPGRAAPGGAAAGLAAGGQAGTGEAGRAGQPGASEEPPPLDLMSVAGSSVYKRLIPLAAVLIVVIGLIIYFAVR